MAKILFSRLLQNFLTANCLCFLVSVSSQTVLYEQNFDGNNGTFTNTLVSQTTTTNGWLASTTAAQYGNYRHVWNFSNVSTGGNMSVLPIDGRSLGMGFWNGNDANVANQYFRTWDGETPSSGSFFTTRWAHVGVSTLGYENITVEFKWRCLGEVDSGKVYDYGTVNTSIDGGATWLMDLTGGQGGTTDTLGTFNGGLYYGNSGVQTATLTLPANRANKANFRLAFRMVVDEGYGTGGGFIVDDIIVRGKAIVLSTPETAPGKTQVYRDGSDFVIRAEDWITVADLYDAGGRKLRTQNGAGREIHFDGTQLGRGLYLLKATLKNGTQVTRKIKK